MQWLLDIIETYGMVPVIFGTVIFTVLLTSALMLLFDTVTPDDDRG